MHRFAEWSFAQSWELGYVTVTLGASQIPQGCGPSMIQHGGPDVRSDYALIDLRLPMGHAPKRRCEI